MMIRSRTAGTAIGLLAAGAVVAGCGGGSSSNSVTAGATSGSGRPGFNFTTAAGIVTKVGNANATVTGNNQTGTVVFGTVTRFTKTVKAKRAALADAECVSVTGSGTPEGTPSSSTTGNVPPTTITARTVTISSSSGCNTRGRVRPGASGTPSPRPRPTGTPGAGGYGGPSGGFRGYGNFVTGTVGAVHGSSFTVTSRGFGSSSTTHRTTVTANSSTEYEVVSTVSESAVKKGECLAVAGQSAGSNAIDAYTVSLSAPLHGQCKTAAGTPPGGTAPGGLRG